MSSGDVDLGALSLVSTTLGYQLSLTSQCRFAPSACDESISLQQLTSRLFEPDRDRKPWVARASDFRLVLHVNSSDETIHETLMDTMSQRLLSSQLWDQLGICPSSVSTVSCGPLQSQITIHLDHTDGTPLRPGRMAHKISRGTPSSHVRPPEGINSVFLKQVLFDLKLSDYQRIPQAKHPPPVKREQEPRNVESALNAAPGDDLATEYASDSAYLNSSSKHDVDHDEGNLIQSEEATCCSADGPSMQSKIDSILQMIEGGVRYGISPSTRNSSTGIKVVCRQSFYALADIAPTLWAPGFLCSISEKAVFLPTISHSLTSVGQRSATQRGKAKIEELYHRHQQVSFKGTDTSVQNVVTESLWHMLQRAELKQSGSKKLKALFLQRSDSETQLNGSDNLGSSQNDGMDASECDEQHDNLQIPERVREDHDDLWLFCDDLDDYSDDVNDTQMTHPSIDSQYDENWASGEMDEDIQSLCDSMSSIEFGTPKLDSLEDCSFAESLDDEMEKVLEAW